MIQNYTQLVDRISKAAGKQADEIDRLVEAKRAKLSGVISREGAAQIVAAELGISFNKEKVKNNELLPGMRKVGVVGQVIRLFPVREFKKGNREGKVANFILADDTGNTRVVLWDTNHIALIEKGEIKEGDFVEITNSSFRDTEVHLSGFSDIKKTDEKIDNVKTERDFFEKSIANFSIGGAFKTRAFIVQVFEPRFFEVCPQCGKKVINDAEGAKCEAHGKVIPEKRALLSVILDDGTENIRAVMFSEQIDMLGLKKEEIEPDVWPDKRQQVFGKEAYFAGTVRQNKLFNNPEFFISDIKEIELDKLIETLEK